MITFMLKQCISLLRKQNNLVIFATKRRLYIFMLQNYPKNIFKLVCIILKCTNSSFSTSSPVAYSISPSTLRHPNQRSNIHKTHLRSLYSYVKCKRIGFAAETYTCRQTGWIISI